MRITSASAINEILKGTGDTVVMEAAKCVHKHFYAKKYKDTAMCGWDLKTKVA